MQENLNLIQRELRVIRDAPLLFGAAVTTAMGCIWGALNWLYSGRLARTKDQNEHLERENKKLQEQMKIVGEHGLAKKPKQAIGDSPAVESARHVVELLGLELRYASPDEMDVFHTYSFEKYNRRVLLAPIYYNPTKSTSMEDLYVKAHILFTDADSKRKVIVPSGCWIDEPLHWVTLVPGSHKSLVLICDAVKGFVAIKNVRGSDDYFSSTTDVLHPLDLSSADKHVELTLMEEGNGFKQTYTFDIKNLTVLMQQVPSR